MQGKESEATLRRLGW